MELLCRQSPCRLAPASEIKCPRQELNLAFDLRRVACESTTLRGQATEHGPRAWPERRAVVANNTVSRQAPRQGIEPCLAVSRTAVLVRHTRRAFFNQSVARPGIEPGLAASEAAVRLRHTHGLFTQSRRLDSHQHRAVYKTAALLSRATSANINQHEREESNPVGRFWRPLPLPGGRS